MPFSAARPSADPQALLPALRTHTWFASCPPPLQEALVAMSRMVTLRAGETLFAPGGAHEGLCCVLAGAVKVGTINPQDGSQRLTLYAEPYQWFGAVGLIDRLPRRQHAIADADSTVLVVPRLHIEPWLDAHPACWRDVARLACTKVRLLLAALDDAANLPVSQLLARRLLSFATGQGHTVQAEPRRRLRLPQEHLASMLGVSRQTVNKSLRALERERVVALHYAEIEILDLDALRERAGGTGDAGPVGRSAPSDPVPPKGRPLG